MIYLDHAATTPVPKAVADAMYTVLTEQYANPNAQYPFGQEMRRSVEDWRAVIAKAVGCEANQLFFTSCGTEGDNWAIRAACWQNRHVGRHIVTTAVEHHAVLNCCQQLEQEGWEVTTILPDQNGDISAESVLAAVRPDTALVSVMMVNNETGARFRVENMVPAIRRKCPRALIHCDVVQAAGKLPLNLTRLGVDLASVSGHKLHAPKGVGLLYVRRGVRLVPRAVGGGQEAGLRSGTEATPAIAALGAAIQSLPSPAEQDALYQRLRRRLMDGLADRADVRFHLPPDGVPYVIHLSVPGVRSETMLHFLAEREIYVSSGSACSKGKKSPVLTAMGLPDEDIDSALRISLGYTNTEEDIDAFVQALKLAADTLARKR